MTIFGCATSCSIYLLLKYDDTFICCMLSLFICLLRLVLYKLSRGNWSHKSSKNRPSPKDLLARTISYLFLSIDPSASFLKYLYFITFKKYIFPSIKITSTSKMFFIKIFTNHYHLSEDLASRSLFTA